MTVSALSAAKTLCEMRGWALSNMALQKVLYLAQMFRLGQSEGTPLVREPFEAWDYGPVVPDLYHRVKPFGSGPVGNVFHWVDEVEQNTADYRALEQAEEGTRRLSPGQLVAITHRSGGAWARHYLPGARGVVIPNEDILREYRLRSAEGAVA